MRLCLTDDEGSFKTIEVSSTLEIENLAPLIELELQIPASRQLLYSNGTQLIDTKRTLASYKINQDDIILVRNHGPAPSTASMSKAEMTRQQILADPDLQRRLIMQNPAIAGALTSPDQFERVFNEMSRQRAAYEQQSQQEMRNLQNADSMDVEAQKRIAEEIRKANVAQNMERAIEYHPESFGRVVMLYIDCEVNGHHVKAFVDSGAQATIMSPECAEACHVMHLLDERFAGVAHGVGTAKILGRIHSTQIKVGKSFLPCSLTVMEGKGVDLLFGLDMLKRHLVSIYIHRITSYFDNTSTYILNHLIGMH
ncbi:DNA damage-inducible protein 1, variant 2 [Batrachochytrium dendrobatidis]|uniref:Ubiquitin-like domain-containing protein n=1 Tax=Batrachochytrium dendrobatidis (strain JEL423) TaxID=403673 RepID=A0A177WXL9_BATDL|nr:DNA damage-inducible protein 1, variant 2 [Batrachochytrium dendrobatidis]OAJ44827.1 hypothetical protein, variant [Batrachochytrium dendrobatidis JEL423]